MLLIEASHLSFSYGDKLIYKEMNFRMMDGEHIALVGANGAGKSTFLRLLTGELLPDHGTIQQNSGLRVGVIQQHLNFDKNLSIYQFLQSAFQELFDAEKKMNELADKMQQPDVSNAQIEKYGQLQDMLIAHDFYTIDAKIKELADGLGLTAIGLEKTVGRLSGGQLTKLFLAKLLLEQPDMLLLDEPTNYLDTSHIDWLTKYLKAYPHAFVVVSHDTAFLNQIADLVYHLENHELVRYVGDYEAFLKQYELRREQVQVAFRQQQREIKKLETYIQKNKARSSTAKQAKSREKKLGKIERIDPPASLKKPHFHFHVSHQPVRLIFSAEKMQVGYDQPLLPPIDFQIHRGEKVAIIGHNGIGKSTFLKTLLKLMPPLSGAVTIGERVQPGYFAQLSSPPDQDPLTWMMDHFPDRPEKELRLHLAQCGVFAEHMRQPMNTLSGGEETKVRIARLMLEKSNVLIFDEPTNHLDVQAKAALSSAISQYDGTVLVVSHEKSFYTDWVTKIWDVEAWSEKKE